MGLSDIYFQRPYAPSQDTLAQVNQIGPAMEEQQHIKMQQEREAIQNERARQELPNAPASPHGQALGGWIKQHLDNHAAVSGAPPGAADRLLSELQGQPQGGGLTAPPQGPMQGPQVPAPPQNLGPTNRYDFTGQPWPTPQQQPFGPPQAQMPQVSSSGGMGYGMGAPPPPQQMRQPLNAGSAFAQDRNSGPAQPQPGGPGPQAPMTNRDLENYMRMAPWAKLDNQKEDPRISINNSNLAYKREALAQRQKLAEMADQTRRELARIMAAYKQSPNDKLLLTQLHEAAANHRAAMGDKAKMDSGLGAIINEQGAQDQIRAEDRADIQAQQEYHDLAERANGPRGRSTSGSVSGPRGKTVTVRDAQGQEHEGPAANLDALMKAHPDWTVVKP